MPRIEGPHNRVHTLYIDQLASVYLSRDRCWHGETFKAMVRTTNINYPAKVTLKIRRRDDRSEIDSVADLALTDSKVDHVFTIDWKTKNLDQKTTDVFVEAIVDGTLEAESPILTVDLEPLAFSC
jgi:hypothetical protein